MSVIKRVVRQSNARFGVRYNCQTGELLVGGPLRFEEDMVLLIRVLMRKEDPLIVVRKDGRRVRLYCKGAVDPEDIIGEDVTTFRRLMG